MEVQGVDFVILACAVLTRYRSVTDERTVASTIAKTREALHAVEHKKPSYVVGQSAYSLIYGLLRHITFAIRFCAEVLDFLVIPLRHAKSITFRALTRERMLCSSDKLHD